MFNTERSHGVWGQDAVAMRGNIALKYGCLIVQDFFRAHAVVSEARVDAISDIRCAILQEPVMSDELLAPVVRQPV